MSDPSPRQGRLSPPTDRVLDVLEAVAADPFRRWALNELVTHTGLTKSTCLGIVNALVERGYLSRDGAGVGLGDGFSRLSGAVDIRILVVEKARPHLLPLAQRGAIVTLTRARPGGLQGLDILAPQFPEQRQRPQSFPYVIPTRSFVAWAAWYPERFVEDRLERAAGRAEPRALERARALIARARADGFCLVESSRAQVRLYEILASLQDPQVPDSIRREVHALLEDLAVLLDRDLEPDEDGAAVEVFAPIFGSESEVVAVVSVFAADRASLVGEDDSETGHAVRDAARAITAELGGVDPWQSGRQPSSRRTG